MRGLFRVSVVLLVVLSGACSDARREGRFRVLASFPVTDTAAELVREPAPGLRVRVRREGGRETPVGWVAEVASSRGDGAPDLPYHSAAWHGPYPSHLLAWSLADGRYPAERVLPVHGHPYELRLRCIRCRTAGRGEAARFTAGAVGVEWRRVRRPFPPADSVDGEGGR